MRKAETFIIILTLIAIIFAWIIGSVLEEKRLELAIKKSLELSGNIIKTGKGIYLSEQSGEVISISSSPGYGGPLTVATKVDKSGHISTVTVISNKETLPFFSKLIQAEFPSKLHGKNYSDNFIPGDDVDSVSGATLSLHALTDAVRKGSVNAAVKVLGLKKVKEIKSRLLFGFKEILLLLLFITGILNYSKLISYKIKKYIRWNSIIFGMVFLGFVYTVPLSIININSFLIGFWPDWHQHIFWYLLLLGVFLPLMIIGKNPYCDTFCPFGAAQEILKLTGGGKKKVPQRIKKVLSIMQKVLAFGVVILALIFRYPGYANYEVFGTFFTLTGNDIQYIIMAVIILLSLFITRPWCNFLCPLRAVSDFILRLRKKFV